MANHIKILIIFRSSKSERRLSNNLSTRRGRRSRIWRKKAGGREGREARRDRSILSGRLDIRSEIPFTCKMAAVVYPRHLSFHSLDPFTVARNHPLAFVSPLPFNCRAAADDDDDDSGGDVARGLRRRRFRRPNSLTTCPLHCSLHPATVTFGIRRCRPREVASACEGARPVSPLISLSFLLRNPHPLLEQGGTTVELYLPVFVK